MTFRATDDRRQRDVVERIFSSLIIGGRISRLIDDDDDDRREDIKWNIESRKRLFFLTNDELNGEWISCTFSILPYEDIDNRF